MVSLRILVVEDDAMIGELLAEILQEIGHRVCEITSSELGAVEAAARHQPDLMIVDANLGSGSGVAAMATILSFGWVPHVFISGGPIGPEGHRGVALRKPFLEHDLVAAIEQAIGTAAIG